MTSMVLWDSTLESLTPSVNTVYSGNARSLERQPYMIGLAMICVSEQERICGCDGLFMYLAAFTQHSIKLRTSREHDSSKAAKRER